MTHPISRHSGTPATAALHVAGASDSPASLAPVVVAHRLPEERISRNPEDRRSTTYLRGDVNERSLSPDRFPHSASPRAAIEGIKDLYLLVKVALKVRKLTGRIFQKLA